MQNDIKDMYTITSIGMSVIVFFNQNPFIANSEMLQRLIKNITPINNINKAVLLLLDIFMVLVLIL
mgnify:FL=1